jgi:3-hydroxyisobutyrate dehydrogenase-like beta-hydroxyacid dehydrogenase
MDAPHTYKLGFIGLGLMGLPMVLNLVAAGHAVQVWNRSPYRYAALANSSAIPVRHASDLSACEIVFINVSDDAAVDSVLFGPAGLINGDNHGQIVVDMGTTSPTFTRQCAERLRGIGVSMLDAPVSGGVPGAMNGTLSIMVGGDADLFSRVYPLFNVLGKRIVHVGDNGAGQVAKACNQIVVSATLMAVAEAFHFAHKQGVDLAQVRDALLGGSAYSKILEVHGQRMISGDYQPGFRVRLHKKDLDIVLAEAAQLSTPTSSIKEIVMSLTSLMEMELGDLDSSAVYPLLSGAIRPDF